MVAQIRVDTVGEIDRRRPVNQFLDLPLGRKDIDLIGKKIDFHRVHELPVVRKLFLPFDKLAEPGNDFPFPFRRQGVRFFLVVPMGGNPLFRHTMHFFGADLKFHRNTFRTDHRGVQGLIHVGLGDGNKVLDPPGDGLPDAVEKAQNPVAVQLGIRDDPDAHQIIDLVERDLLQRHLSINAIDMLVSPENPSGNTVRSQGLLRGLDNKIDIVFPLFPPGRNPRAQVLECLRFKHRKGQILELGLHPPDPKPVCQRGVDFKCFLGNRALPGSIQ